MRHQYLVFRTYYVTILMSFSYIPEGEYLYERLTNPYIAQLFSGSKSGEKYDALLLALETTDSFNDALYDVMQTAAQILYLMRCQDADYEGPE
ncbi:hypothetical protein BJP41_08145 [Candidatus Williamhamiltonella defendens]|uniref:Uncharacterized protein n=2 Tax=Candidatus Williamhamiltonella defendens TaxID=138072 RepID=A0A2D3T941_9ENTR|nr:hypothetical protein BJP41_08145 [Candidatus Hamiltonella defensa]ATW32300.1 hypothetical protein BJP42_08445 [Candidatus Hamiltonella defensa]